MLKNHSTMSVWPSGKSLISYFLDQGSIFQKFCLYVICCMDVTLHIGKTIRTQTCFIYSTLREVG